MVKVVYVIVYIIGIYEKFIKHRNINNYIKQDSR